MNERVKRPLKAILASVIHILVSYILVPSIRPTVHGEIHLNNWQGSIQDKIIIGTLTVIYFAYLYKMSKRPFNKETKL
jgi:hypothetical protein